MPGLSWLTAFGPYGGRGGRLWVEHVQGTHAPPAGVVLPPDAPERLLGVYLDPFMKWVSFDASAWHAVEAVQGTRCSISCYSPVASEATVHPQEIGSHVDEVSEWDALPEYYMCVHDTISGQPLDPSLVAAGCKQEMDFLRNLNAYEYSTVQECVSRTGKPPVSVGWVYVNKGDSDAPNVRCRLVVKETRWRSTITDPSQTWSATPPYEALRFLCSLCMSPLEGEEGYVLQFIDITRAHPHCAVKRELWIQLPLEDPRS
eukprot:4448201-Amphidinium_carterae.2